MYTFTTEANCIGIDVNMFFTEEDSSIYPEENLLERTCNSCVVKTQCLDYALHHNVQGWWGGTSEAKRRKLRQQLNIIAIPVIIERQGNY